MVVPGAACKASGSTPNNMGPTCRLDGDATATEGYSDDAFEVDQTAKTKWPYPMDCGGANEPEPR
jgi:hypothetical protein